MTAATTIDAIVTEASARYWKNEYPTTRMRPMRPASRPLTSWLLPSVGEIESRLCTMKLTGSAPNFSWLARAVAVSCVKLPVIDGWSDGAWTYGAVMTRPSSTAPNWLRGVGKRQQAGRQVLDRGRALGVEADVDRPAAGVDALAALFLTGECVGDVGALDLDRTEQVLDRAGVVAGDERLVCRSDVGLDLVDLVAAEGVVGGLQLGRHPGRVAAVGGLGIRRRLGARARRRRRRRGVGRATASRSGRPPRRPPACRSG